MILSNMSSKNIKIFAEMKHQSIFNLGLNNNRKA